MVLLPPVGIAPASCQRAEKHGLTFLVAIKSNGSGLEIHTHLLENHGYEGISDRSQTDLEPSKTQFIPHRRLPPECGDQYFRCQEPLVDTLSIDSGGNNIIFLPLENGMLLLRYWYNSNNMNILEKSSFIVNSSNCSPTVFYKIDSKIYTACVNSSYFSLYEVQLQLNGSEIENASLHGPLTQISSNNSLNFSNFVLIEHKVYVAVGNIIMDISINNNSQRFQESVLDSCTQIHKLATVEDSQQRLSILAYCTDKSICFDPVYYGDWTCMRCFSTYGVPDLCPDNDYKATYFINGTLQLSLRDVLRSTINNVNISSGICFESQNITYFAYSDQQHNNVYVYDFTTQNHYPVSPYDCPRTHQDCPQLLFRILENQYLVIRDANHNLVLDATTNFSLLTNISSGIADILVILHSNVNVCTAITPSPTIFNIHSTPTATVTPAPGIAMDII